jgi:hypothetical protein
VTVRAVRIARRAFTLGLGDLLPDDGGRPQMQRATAALIRQDECAAGRR